MAIKGLVVGLIIAIVFGLVLIPLMIVGWYAAKGDIKSSYNYRPKWARVDLPEDVKTKINKECTKWLIIDSGAYFCAMVIGWAYCQVSGNYNAFQFIVFACINIWVLIMFATIVGAYVYARSLEKKYNTGKTG